MTQTYTLSPTTDRILAEMEGHTRDAPGWLDEIATRLDVPPDMLWDAVESLQDAGRVVRCDITRDGQTRVALWPTGLIRPGYTAEQAIVRQHTAARAAQEHPMPSTPHPPEPAEPAPRRLFGDVQREILTLLDPLTESEALSPPDIHDRLTLSASIGSTRKTLQRLAGLGLIGSRVDGVGTGRRATYWGLQGQRMPVSQPPAPQAPDDTETAAPLLEEDPTIEAKVRAALEVLRDWCGNHPWGWDGDADFWIEAFDRRFAVRPEDFLAIYSSIDTLVAAEDVAG